MASIIVVFKDMADLQSFCEERCTVSKVELERLQADNLKLSHECGCKKRHIGELEGELFRLNQDRNNNE